MSNQQHHYFVSHALGWATGEDLESTIEKLWQGRHTDVKKWLTNAQKEGNPGINFFACKVPLPADADYKIEWYCPKVEGLTECGNHLLTYYTQKKIAHCPDRGDDVRKLQQQLRDTKAQLEELRTAVENHESA
jgi:hypothetical protein